MFFLLNQQPAGHSPHAAAQIAFLRAKTQRVVRSAAPGREKNGNGKRRTVRNQRRRTCDREVGIGEQALWSRRPVSTLGISGIHVGAELLRER